MNRSPDSLRSRGGVEPLSLDRQTKAIIRQLAGDMPLCHYIRSLVELELAKTGKPKALRGTERMVSDNTIASVKADTANAISLLEALSLAVRPPQLLSPGDISKLEHSQLSFLTDKEVSATCKAAVAEVGGLLSRARAAWEIIVSGKVKT